MAPSPRPTSRLRLSLRQMCWLVALCALQCAVIVPALRAGWPAWFLLLVAEVFALPIFAGMAIALLVPPHVSWRSWLVHSLMCLPVVMLALPALAGSVYALAHTVLYAGSWLIACFVILADLFLGWLLVVAVDQVLPRRCPDCRAWSLVLNPAGNDPQCPGVNARWCFRCQASFVPRERHRWARLAGPRSNPPGQDGTEVSSS